MVNNPNEPVEINFKIPTPKKFSFGSKEECKKLLFDTYVEIDKSREIIWLPEYDEIADWLSDTKGKGLLLTGDCGRGKTKILTRVIPKLFESDLRKIITPCHIDNLHKEYEMVSAKWCYCIDDLGAEHETNDYGERYYPSVKLIHIADNEYKFCLFSTNLTSESIKEKYGERILDRLVQLCRVVKCEGKSLRQ